MKLPRRFYHPDTLLLPLLWLSAMLSTNGNQARMRKPPRSLSPISSEP